MTTDSSGRRPTRRSFLAATGAVAGVAATTAASAPALAQGDGYGGWFDGVSNFDGTVDRTGQSEVTVQVGSDANGGPYGFGPAAVRVDPGTEVTFEWVSDTHNVVVDSQPSGAGWSGHETIENGGFSFSHTFETEGVYTYFCEPHTTMGMKGAVVVGGSGGGGGGGGDVDYRGWFGGVDSFDGTVDERGTDTLTVEVGAEGNGGTYAYAPTAVRIDPGTTVTFDWVSDTHNVEVQSQPGGANWSGHETIEDTGFSFEHTFETEGVYRYFCAPHESLGMKGAIVVGDVSGMATGGGESPGPIQWTPTAIAGVAALGLATASSIGVPLYMWRNQRRDDAVDAGSAGGEPADLTPVAEAPAYEPEQRIGHDEYDPVGTLSLILVYLAILAVMWVFVYFVEFLGNGPTIIG